MSFHLRLGELYLSQGLYDAAAEAYRQALSELPTDARGNAWWGLGSALARAGDSEGAAEVFGSALTERPRNIALAVEYLDALRATAPQPKALCDRLGAHPAVRHNPILSYGLSNGLLALGDLPQTLALREAVLGLGDTVTGRTFHAQRFRRSALFLLSENDAAAEISAWDIVRRLDVPVHADGYTPPLGRRESGRALLAVLPDGLFLGGETWVADAAGRIHVDLHFDIPGQRMPFYFHVDGPDADVSVLLPEPCAMLDGAAIALGGSVNYYHWMVDFLPRLIAVLAEPALAGVPLLINAQRAPFQDWWLNALNVPQKRLIEVPYPGAVRCRRLIVPILPFWERVAVMAPYRGTRTPDGKRLFVTREDGHRRLHGEAETAALLAERGFLRVDPGRLPPQDQIALFQNAACVVGPHGAGLVNALFAPSEAPLAEILNPAWRQPFFANLAAAACRPYAAVDAEPCIEEDRLPLFWNMTATAQTRDALSAALNALPGGLPPAPPRPS